MTLDLTNPFAPPRRQTVLPTARGGTRLKWLNHATKRSTYAEYKYPEKHRRMIKKNLDGSEDEVHVGEGEVEVEVEPAEEDEEDEEAENANEQSDENENENLGATMSTQASDISAGQANRQPLVNGPSSREVQILDLHTDEPVVSYNGQVYSCQWAQNVGSELLFMQRSQEHDIPMLRSLPDNVDLLGALSTRILSTPATMQLKADCVPSESPDPFPGRRLDPNLRIPIGHGAKRERKEQALFLEHLMDIKEAKGERDFVTVIAQKRMLNSQWRQKLKSLRSVERTRLKKIASTRHKDDPEVQAACVRLREMDEEDEKRQNRDINRNSDARGEQHGKKGRKKKFPGAEDQVNRRPSRAANIAAEKFGGFASN